MAQRCWQKVVRGLAMLLWTWRWARFELIWSISDQNLTRRRRKETSNLKSIRNPKSTTLLKSQDLVLSAAVFSMPKPEVPTVNKPLKPLPKKSRLISSVCMPNLMQTGWSAGKLMLVVKMGRSRRSSRDMRVTGGKSSCRELSRIEESTWTNRDNLLFCLLMVMRYLTTFRQLKTLQRPKNRITWSCVLTSNLLVKLPARRRTW